MKTIACALVKAQSQFKPVTKDSENPFFKSNYADLSSILQAVMPVLSANGLALSQPMKVVGESTILCTNLIHESGEMLSSEMILPSIVDPQKYGSLITYYKRYQLQALLGISTQNEDDDANHASQVYNKPITQINNGTPASPAQIGALKKLGIQHEPSITKQEASKLLENFNKGR